MWNLFNRLYPGGIRRLVIVAAPSGAGKSTFLDNPAAMLGAEFLPAELSDFHEIAMKHETIRNLRSVRKSGFDSLCMHVDLSRPIRKLDWQTGDRDELNARLTPRLYSEWKDLAAYTRRAAEVHVVTMFVRRETHFRRWTERTQRKGETRKFRPRVRTLSSSLAAINGDSTNHSELHRKAYSAWRQYVAALGASSTHILDANSDKYSFINQADFDDEIEFGYRENETTLEMVGGTTASQLPLPGVFRRAA